MNPSLSLEDGARAILVVGACATADVCAALLTGAGARVTVCREPDRAPEVRGFDAVVLAAERPLPRVALAIDAACWEAGVPWTEAALLAHEFRVGPGIIPGSTPCYTCFSRRVRALAVDLRAHDATIVLANATGDQPWFRGQFRPLTEQVAALAAAEALALARGEYVEAPARMGRYWEGNAMFGVLRGGVVAGVGFCSACAPAGAEEASWVKLARHFGASSPARGDLR